MATTLTHRPIVASCQRTISDEHHKASLITHFDGCRPRERVNAVDSHEGRRHEILRRMLLSLPHVFKPIKCGSAHRKKSQVPSELKAIAGNVVQPRFRRSAQDDFCLAWRRIVQGEAGRLFNNRATSVPTAPEKR